MKKDWMVVLVGLALLGSACGGESPTAELPLTELPASEAAPSATASAKVPVGGSQHFQIASSASEARFIIGEVLMGQDNTVTGATDQVQGGFDVDLAAPDQVTFEPIVIDATGFVTDENRRDQAIRRFILETASAANASITFTPTAVKGLPSTVEVGQGYPVSIQGNLEIHGVRQPVTFSGTVTATSPSQIVGSFSTSIQRSDFNLNIPSVRLVASVDEQLRLEFDFTAEAAQ